MRFTAAILTALFVTTSAADAQPAASPRQIIESPAFRTATAFLEKDHERFVRELITLTEIPAPPFKEKARGKRFSR